MNNEPNFDPRGAVDLGKLRDVVAEREAAEAAAAERAEEIALVKWDRAMTRAFKGIFSRSQRRIFARAALKRMEAE